MRWKIETFHKILKSGCRAEDSRLRTAQRLTNLIALLCTDTGLAHLLANDDEPRSARGACQAGFYAHRSRGA